MIQEKACPALGQRGGYRFSEKIMLKRNESMIRKSGYRFSEKIMLKRIK
jgi:hypothetical protein